MLNRKGIALAAGLVACWATLGRAYAEAPSEARAGIAKSADYALEYSAVSASGAAVTNGSYTVVSQVKTKGFNNQPVASGSYSVVPLTGGTGSATSTVPDWSLY